MAVLEPLLESPEMPPWEAMKVKLGVYTDHRTVLILEPGAIYQGELNISSRTRLRERCMS